MNTSYRTELLPLYDTAVTDERHFYSTLLKITRLYWSIVSATIAGAWYGITTTKPELKNLLLIIASMVIILQMQAAIEALERTYKRLLEAIAIRAMIEKELGLTKVVDNNNDNNNYWNKGAILPENQIEYRKRFESAGKFIDDTFKNKFKPNKFFTRGSIFSKSRNLFRIIEYLSIVFLIIGLISYL